MESSIIFTGKIEPNTFFAQITIMIILPHDVTIYTLCPCHTYYVAPSQVMIDPYLTPLHVKLNNLKLAKISISHNV